MNINEIRKKVEAYSAAGKRQCNMESLRQAAIFRNM